VGEVPRWRRGSGRPQVIQCLIGRSLLAALNLEALGEHTLLINCDVLQGDADTLTATSSGAWQTLAVTCERRSRAVCWRS
jgi:ribonuclease PH